MGCGPQNISSDKSGVDLAGNMFTQVFFKRLVSQMLWLRVVAYFVPLAVNVIIGGMIFFVPLQLSRLGCSGTVVSAGITSSGAVYCLTNLLLGRIVSAANAAIFIVSGGLLLLLVSLGFILLDGFGWLFIWIALEGCGTALVCTPFQLLAKDLEDGSKSSGAVMASSIYLFTGSVGLALGPLFFGLLGKGGFYVTLLLAAAVAVCVMAVEKYRRTRNKPDFETNMVNTPAPEAYPMRFTMKTYDRLGYLGWIIGGLGVTTVCQMRAMWPKLGSELHISGDDIAYVIAVFNFVQAIVCLALCRSKDWMFRRFPALLMTVSAVLSLGVFACSHSLWSFYAASAIYGVYGGCFFFCMICLGLMHPERNSFFVSGNEVLVGCISIIAPLAGGVCADIFGTSAAAFVFAVVVALLAFTAQLVILSPRFLQTVPSEK